MSDRISDEELARLEYKARIRVGLKQGELTAMSINIGTVLSIIEELRQRRKADGVIEDVLHQALLDYSSERPRRETLALIRRALSVLEVVVRQDE